MIDKKDHIILESLRKNSKQSVQQVSRATHIPITTVHNRIKKLEHDNVIKGYTTVVDKKKIGKNVEAYILVTVDYKELKKNNKTQEELARSLKKINDVDKVSLVTGEQDMIVHVSTHNIKGLNNVVLNKLRRHDGIHRTTTAVIIDNLEE